MVTATHCSRVLIVEDEPDIRSGLTELFSAEGYYVEAAENGATGLDDARSHHPDLIVLDLMMPVMDGFEFLDRQRSDAALAGIPVIVLTARRPAPVSACEIVYKPFEVVVLLDAAARCLGGAASGPSGPA